jgi:hypothetical protein
MNLTEAQKAIETILAEVYECGYEEGRKNRCIEEEFQNTNKYEDGLNDAWEAAKKIVCTDGYNWTELENMFNSRTLSKIFNTCTASEAIEKVKEYEERLKEPVFKVGDRVRTLIDKDSMGVELFPVGTIGEVTDVSVDGNAIEVNADGKKWYYLKKDIELANDVIIVGDEVYCLDANYHGVVTAVWEDCGVVKTERLTQSGKLACDDAKDLHRTGRRFPEIANILKQMQEGNEND